MMHNKDAISIVTELRRTDRLFLASFPGNIIAVASKHAQFLRGGLIECKNDAARYTPKSYHA